MFTIESITEHGFEKIRLTDNISGTFAEIIPGCGGILHSFFVLHHGSSLNVIDGYESREDFNANVTAKGFKGCKLSPFACRIKKGAYRFGEAEYKIEKFFLGPHAIHGLIYDADFDITYQYADDAHAGLAIKYRYRGDDRGFPFSYDCIITYHLKKNNELIVATNIISQEEERLMPLQDGWHPYFKLGGKIDDWLLEFQSKEKIIFDETMIPTGEKLQYEAYGSLEKIADAKFDDCFSLNFAECQPLCVVRNPEQKIQVEIRPDKHYPYMQIYTPDHRTSIAIENLSGAPDCFNNAMGLVILPPMGNMVFTTSYTITSLK